MQKLSEEELPGLSSEERTSVAAEENVFAQTRPERLLLGFAKELRGHDFKRVSRLEDFSRAERSARGAQHIFRNGEI